MTERGVVEVWDILEILSPNRLLLRATQDRGVLGLQIFIKTFLELSEYQPTGGEGQK
jgi:hypothetical protein